MQLTIAITLLLALLKLEAYLKVLIAQNDPNTALIILKIVLHICKDNQSLHCMDIYQGYAYIIFIFSPRL